MNGKQAREKKRPTCAKWRTFGRWQGQFTVAPKMDGICFVNLCASFVKYGAAAIFVAGVARMTTEDAGNLASHRLSLARSSKLWRHFPAAMSQQPTSAPNSSTETLVDESDVQVSANASALPASPSNRSHWSSELLVRAEGMRCTGASVKEISQVTGMSIRAAALHTEHGAPLR